MALTLAVLVALAFGVFLVIFAVGLVREIGDEKQRRWEAEQRAREEAEDRAQFARELDEWGRP